MTEDPRLRDLAGRSPNFGFLLRHEPLLVAYGAGAEAIVFTDPNGALIKCRQFIEVLTAVMIRSTGIPVDGHNLVHRINALTTANVITPNVADAFHQIRRSGNEAVHAHAASAPTALRCLERCFQLGLLLHRAITGERELVAFVPLSPPALLASAELTTELERFKSELAEAKLVLDGSRTREQAEAEARQAAEAELNRAQADRDGAAAQVQALAAELNALRARFEQETAGPAKVSPARRDAIGRRARQAPPLTEAQTRRTIDRMLSEAGWIVQDMPELNPGAGRGVAVREFAIGRKRADYVLYVDQKIVGVIEAKREGTPLTGVEWQSDDYASALPGSHRMAVWRRDEPLPFRYESTGVETHFTCTLDPDSRSREVFSFHRPETIARWMAEAGETPQAPTFRARLRTMPPLDADGLRPAQADAIERMERHLRGNHQRALVQMATGAGKTFTAVTLSYRLFRYAGVKRVLFLVDRNNLGDQAAGEFARYVTDSGQTLGEDYTVQRLSSGTVLDSASVVVTTIQRLYRALTGQPLPAGEADEQDVDDFVPSRPVDAVYNTALPPEAFDLVVVDECHRSIFGRWRAVLQYFDAPVVGLTATPTAQALAFFGDPVSEYTYEQSVADRVNVDFAVFRIKTKIGEDGSTIPALDEDGTRTVVPKRDRRTRRQRYEELDEDFTYGSREIGRSVVAKDQIRTVVSAYRDHVLPRMFPHYASTVPKTLIFAQDDSHADDIVQAVRDVFGKGNDFCAKITYRSKLAGEDPKDLLRRLRTSADLRIAVTVDMVATGTDVKPLECVFFMRSVRSAVYFEQMKGRGCRTIDPDDFQAVTPDEGVTTKDRFVIVDAVGVTDHPLCQATPLNRDPENRLSLKQLLSRAAALSLDEAQTATLAARLDALDRKINDAERDELAQVGQGTTLRELVQKLATAVDPDELAHTADQGGEDAVAERLREAARPLAENPELRERIIDIRDKHDQLIDEISRDKVTDASVVPRERIARNTVESFRSYLRTHRDSIALMRALEGSGTVRLSWAEVSDLAHRIERVPLVGNVTHLWEAYEKTEDKVRTRGYRARPTDLVSIIRYELRLDAELRPFRSIVEERYAARLARHQAAEGAFSPMQRWFLDKLCEIIVNSAEVAEDALDYAPFDLRGGEDGFYDAFGDRAPTLLDDLTRNLTA
ncbi:DEAD/DEAH box helicase family protein [Microbispora amethystogenes]|uniref:Type III restriction endonuclease subunit R n=1 Tax=Microbispora amethystogenes TaxID=1427754 RepID=A0ABQ4F620_9ACTN|nr:DEAD/DEAH box helicase family protein [Microbispora amethystogenes]GIH30250.1 type III restriction endonuclease subunit R [Microbispora amethystogenes]